MDIDIENNSFFNNNGAAVITINFEQQFIITHIKW